MEEKTTIRFDVADQEMPPPRVLPLTVAAAAPGREALNARRVAVRKHTLTKRTLFYEIYNRLVAEIDPRLAEHPETRRQAGWKAVCSHRFCTQDINARQTLALIETATRAWLTAMRVKHFGAVGDIHMPVGGIHPRMEDGARAVNSQQNTEERLRREAAARREAQIILDRAAAMRREAVAPEINNLTPRFLVTNWQNLPPAEVVNLLRGVPRDQVNVAIQDMSPAVVGKVFEILGLGESGEMCSVCMEPRTSWANFTKNCTHAFCTACAIEWAKLNVSAIGAPCPFCVKNGVPGDKCIADPVSMFSRTLLKQTAALIPFSAAQIPPLQRALDAKFSGVGAGTSVNAGADALALTPAQVQARTVTLSGRCPECSTVSTHGNDFIRRCHNPICASEFCLKCNCALAATELHAKHIDGTCINVAEEVKTLVKGEGLTPCPGCGSQIWHAVGHACHVVKCPVCAFKFCHACGTPCDQGSDHASKCSCPIFCGGNFKCRCAKACPECLIKKCEHCNGGCPTCLQRISRK